MYKKLAFLIAIIAGASATAQQLSQFSQYLMNPFILNPAVAGADKHLNLTAGYRNQWTGFDQSPTTFYLTGHKQLTKDIVRIVEPLSIRTSVGREAPKMITEEQPVRHSVGGALIHDEWGMFTKTYGYGAYSVSMPLTDAYRIAFGASLGISNFQFDRSQAVLYTENDQTFDRFSGGGNRVIVDANFGVNVTSDKAFLGYSTNQLLRNKITFDNNAVDSRLHIHHFLYTGYHYEVNPDWTLTPSLLLKYMNPAPLSFDVNLMATYQDKYWLGTAYRYQDAAVVLLGMQIDEMFSLGYSYDITVSGFSGYSNGSHEIVLRAIIPWQENFGNQESNTNPSQ